MIWIEHATEQFQNIKINHQTNNRKKSSVVRLPAYLEQRSTIISAQQALTSIRRTVSSRPCSADNSDNEGSSSSQVRTPLASNLPNLAIMTSIEKEERVRIGKQNITVSMLQGPSNHAIWKARLLAALNAEDSDLYAVATGEWKLKTDVDEDDSKGEIGDQMEGEAGVEEGEKRSLQCKRAHERCIPLITSTLPDQIFAMVMNQANDAFKLMETIDARFRPYPRYAAIQD